ncbi:DUF218 domain-containing protein [Trichoderma novae-zelandiae]
MTQTDQVHRDASLVYDYHRMNLPLRPADAIFCLCSLDTRVAAHAARLYLDGIAPRLIFSGDAGILTKGLFSEPEAVVFAAVARGMGVPEDAIIVEPRARNTGENVRFTYDLLGERGLLERFRSLVLVQKPYMERRTYATFRKQWPDEGTLFTVSSPALSFDEYPDASNPRELVTSIMVGDLVRIREYPAKGFQIEQEIPEEVWEAGQRLVRAGFDKHLP